MLFATAYISFLMLYNLFLGENALKTC